MSLLRTWVAVVFALFVPGTGHAVIREWRRSLLWFFLYVGAVALFAPLSGVESSGSILDATRGIAAELSTVESLALSVVTFLNMVDVYVLATSNRRPGSDEPTCPNCGREVDPEIEFCHWCTTRLEE